MAREAIAVVKVRLSPPLRAALDRAAETQKTSLNSQIEQRLERSFDLLDQLERVRIAHEARVALGNLTRLQRVLHEHGLQDAGIVTSDCAESMLRILEMAMRKTEEMK